MDLDNFYAKVRTTWSIYKKRDPLSIFLHKTKKVKLALKEFDHSSGVLSEKVINCKKDQLLDLSLFGSNPSDPSLATNLKKANELYYLYAKMEYNWIKQRAKETWLSKGEDDLKFLFSSIKERKNSNKIREIFLSLGFFPPLPLFLKPS